MPGPRLSPRKSDNLGSGASLLKLMTTLPLTLHAVAFRNISFAGSARVLLRVFSSVHSAPPGPGPAEDLPGQPGVPFALMHTSLECPICLIKIIENMQ